MKTRNTTWLAVTAFALTATVLIAWKGNDYTPFRPDQPNDFKQDTTIRNKKSAVKKEYRMGDLDQAMKELDNSMADIDKNLKIDLGKMDIDIKNAMKEINNIDFGKIGEEVSNAIKKIDWDGINRQISNAVQEATAHLNEADMKKVTREIERAKQNIDKAKIRSDIDLSGLHKTIEKSMEAARTGIEKAKKEIGRQDKRFFGGLSGFLSCVLVLSWMQALNKYAIITTPFLESSLLRPGLIPSTSADFLRLRFPSISFAISSGVTFFIFLKGRKVIKRSALVCMSCGLNIEARCCANTSALASALLTHVPWALLICGNCWVGHFIVRVAFHSE